MFDLSCMCFVFSRPIFDILNFLVTGIQAALQPRFQRARCEKLEVGGALWGETAKANSVLCLEMSTTG